MEGFRREGRRNDSRQGGRRNDFRRDSGPREMHKATCTECKKECEVPFKPTPGKDVFCQECFRKRKRY